MNYSHTHKELEIYLAKSHQEQFDYVFDLVGKLAPGNENYATIQEKMKQKPEIFDKNLLMIVFESMLEYAYEIEANEKEHEREIRTLNQWRADRIKDYEQTEHNQADDLLLDMQ